jgi:AbrB family looped-hinge helix DNA binding protein
MSHPFAKILGTATLNDKGQLVIPAEARQDLDLGPGSKVVIMKSPDKQALILLKAEEVESMIKDMTDALEGESH